MFETICFFLYLSAAAIWLFEATASVESGAFLLSATILLSIAAASAPR